MSTVQGFQVWEFSVSVGVPDSEVCRGQCEGYHEDICLKEGGRTGLR